MKSFLQNSTISVPVLFQQDGEPVVPDSGTFTWTLRGQDGTILSGPTTVSGIVDTKAKVSVASTLNVISGSALYEKRTLITSWLVGTFPFTHQQTYRITNWLNYSITLDDVRTFVGAGNGFVADDEMDLVQAYLDVASVITSTTLNAALIAGGDYETAANRAIVAQVVISLIPSMQARFIKKESDGQISVENGDIDLMDLERRASDLLSRSLNLIGSRAVITPTFIVAATRTDPVTGA